MAICKNSSGIVFGWVTLAAMQATALSAAAVFLEGGLKRCLQWWSGKLTDLGACCVQDDCRDRILCNPHYQKLEQAAGVWRKVLVVSATFSPLSVLLAMAEWSEAGSIACTRQQLQNGQGSFLKVELHCAS